MKQRKKMGRTCFRVPRISISLSNSNMVLALALCLCLSISEGAEVEINWLLAEGRKHKKRTLDGEDISRRNTHGSLDLCKRTRSDLVPGEKSWVSACGPACGVEPSWGTYVMWYFSCTSDLTTVSSCALINMSLTLPEEGWSRDRGFWPIEMSSPCLRTRLLRGSSFLPVQRSRATTFVSAAVLDGSYKAVEKAEKRTVDVGTVGGPRRGKASESIREDAVRKPALTSCPQS